MLKDEHLVAQMFPGHAGTLTFVFFLFVTCAMRGVHIQTPRKARRERNPKIQPAMRVSLLLYVVRFESSIPKLEKFAGNQDVPDNQRDKRKERENQPRRS